MNTLHTFGDSFTFGYGCVENCHFKSYYKYKKEGDDIWPNHLSKKLGMNILNYGKNGFSNEQIFDSVLQNFDYINENDLVIIGKTVHGRLAVPNNSEWISIMSYIDISDEWKPHVQKKFSNEEFESLINFQYYFLKNKLYRDRDNDRFDFLKQILTKKIKVKNCIVWDGPKTILNFENIKKVTNGKINDLHFSFDGHKQFSNYLENILNNKLL